MHADAMICEAEDARMAQLREYAVGVGLKLQFSGPRNAFAKAEAASGPNIR